VLLRRGTSLVLAGLPEPFALQLVARELGRAPRAGEQSPLHELWVAVEGQPLRLRQAAALVREESLSFAALAEEVRNGGPDALDRRSLTVLHPAERRVLAVLALAAGVLVPADLVAAMAAGWQVRESLGDLLGRGLAERQEDRYGLPVCSRDSYRQNLLGDLEVGGGRSRRDPGQYDRSRFGLGTPATAGTVPRAAATAAARPGCGGRRRRPRPAGSARAGGQRVRRLVRDHNRVPDHIGVRNHNPDRNHIGVRNHIPDRNHIGVRNHIPDRNHIGVGDGFVRRGHHNKRRTQADAPRVAQPGAGRVRSRQHHSGQWFIIAKRHGHQPQRTLDHDQLDTND
jgi:hypothetical protein